MTADELRAALEELDLRNNQFAEMTGHDVQTVSRWVCSRLKVPKDIALIAELLLERKRRPKFSGSRL